MITIKALKEEIEFFNPKPFDYFIQKGLNQKSNPNNTIALFLGDKDKYMLKYYCFNNSDLEMKNDIPFYHKDIPEGYYIFCTRLEYLQLMAHLNKNGKKKTNKIIDKKQSIEIEPIPNKRNFLCHFCHIKFDNYIEHINSKIHENNVLRYHNNILKIQLTFRRIVNFWEIQKKKISNESTCIEVIELKDSVGEQKENNTSMNNFEINNNDKTKEDSYFTVNDGNKENNKTKQENFNEENNNNNCDKKDDCISIKDILNILDSINGAKENILRNLKKRKKNEKKKYFHDNYIFDLQKITDKIAHFKSIMNK